MEQVKRFSLAWRRCVYPEDSVRGTARQPAPRALTWVPSEIVTKVSELRCNKRNYRMMNNENGTRGYEASKEDLSLQARVHLAVAVMMLAVSQVLPTQYPRYPRR